VNVNENLNITINIKWLIQIVLLVAGAVGGYFDIKSDIREAALSPASPQEFQMRVEFTADEILELEHRIEKLEARHETNTP